MMSGRTWSVRRGMLTCGSVIVLLILGVSLIGSLQQKKWGGSAVLEIKDLRVQFHTSDHEAVRGIDLTVQTAKSWGWWAIRLRQDRDSHDGVRPAAGQADFGPHPAGRRGSAHAGGQRIRAIQGKDICVVFQGL
ncbi:MAG: hypothetical protein ACLTGT_04175 [Oscillospiraceae bacterium]